MHEADVISIRHTASGRALARQLQERISNGALSVGVKLPSERNLSEEFGISRGTVRKVLDGFVDAGIFRRVVGSGTFVAASPESALDRSPSSTDVSPAELMEARLLFEPLLPSLIVRNARISDFEVMTKCLVASEQAGSVEEFEHWDGRFHEALSHATHNPFMVSVLELMQQVRNAGEWGTLKQAALTPARRARYEAQHRAIVAALRERDEPVACALIREHLVEVEANLFGRT